MKNQIYKGARGKESLVDLTLPSTYSGKLVLFVHGYMGFKDWGCWNLVEEYFLQLGFGFCKYNVSHNGCSTNDPMNFVDLTSFSQNNYSKEIEDFNAILAYLAQHVQPFPELFVIGHSRGGGIALLTTNDARVKKIATWAAISDIASRFPQGQAFEAWEKSGFYHRINGRTQQEMPHHFSQYLDYISHTKKLHIEAAVRANEKPLLLIHGDADTSVPLDEGKAIAEWSVTKLNVLEGAAHNFGSAHPWTEEKMPVALEQVCRMTAAFFLAKN